MPGNDAFQQISEYWSDQVNSEIYLLDRPDVKRGSKEYFDIILRERSRYLYYLDEIVEFFEEKQLDRSRLLEIGCGVGCDLLKFSEMNGVECHGVDLSDEHIRLSKLCFELYGRNAVIKKGNAEALDYPDEHFDFVYSLGVIHHTQAPQNAIDEAYRVMKKGGSAAIMLYNKYSLNKLAHKLLMRPYENPKKSRVVARDAPFVYTYSKSELNRMFEAFSLVRIERRYLYGPGWGAVYKLTPKRLYLMLSKLVGWHNVLFLTK